MNEFVTQYWPYLVVGLLIAIAIAIYIFLANRKAAVVSKGPKRDVLDEGGSPAARNQALIDAPRVPDAPGAPAPTAPTPNISEAANADAIAAAPASADAEAGPAIAPSKPVEPRPAAPNVVGGDDLTTIKGLGPKLATTLNGLGISSFAQIAEWDEAEIDRIDAQLGRFAGRIRRDNWVEQAKLLVSDDKNAFAEKFGNN